MIEFLSNYKIIASFIVIIIGILIRFLSAKSLRKIRINFDFQKSRMIVIYKIITFLIYCTIVVLIAFIWGVDEKQLIVYISSFLTIVGIAFFAQWSLLSNITAGLILFINYPVKIGDTITILEKDNNTSGEIIDIGAFFITLKTKENQMITMPNSIVLQKNISYKKNKN
jgi:small-conductance mechanosensitive channel